MNIPVIFPDHLIITADKLAERLGISRNELIRAALIQYLEEHQVEPAGSAAIDTDEDW